MRADVVLPDKKTRWAAKRRIPTDSCFFRTIFPVSYTHLILKNAEEDPTILVGGNLPEIGGNVKVGASEHFVTEACEYMDSFLSLRPKIEIILNIDSDHLDYFKDIEHIANSFEKFASLVPVSYTHLDVYKRQAGHCD